jgi:hypothetical protein
MKHLAASALAIASAGGFLPEAVAQDRSRHFEFGIFTLNLGEAADLTSDHIPLEFVQVWAHPFGNRAINISVRGLYRWRRRSHRPEEPLFMEKLR